MAKKAQTTDAVETTPATTTEPNNLPVLMAEGVDFNDPKNFEMFANAPDEAMMEAVDPSNIEFEEGELWNLKYLGLEERTFGRGTPDEQTKDIALFEDIEGKPRYNGNVFLVNRLRNIPVPNFVRIVCTGEEKGKSGGKFKTFSVKAAYLK